MSFDGLARFYRTMEWVTAGGKLQRCRMAFVGEIPVPRQILMVGEGHGRFLPECVRRFPEARIVVVDASARMLEIARGKVAAGRVEFMLGDFLELEGGGGEFDLIVTHFFLDCFTAEELREVVAKLGRMASARAEWLLADFEIAAGGVARWRSRMIVGMLYGFFGRVTGLRADSLVVPDGEIERAGFTRHRRATYEWGLLKSEWWRRGG